MCVWLYSCDQENYTSALIRRQFGYASYMSLILILNSRPNLFPLPVGLSEVNFTSVPVEIVFYFLIICPSRTEQF